MALAAALLAVLVLLGKGRGPELPPEVREYLELPEVDLRAEAEALWAADQRETALVLLDYIVDNALPDAPAAAELQRHYVQQLEADQSALGRLRAFGRGFLVGRVNSWSELGGSTVGDFFVWGDVRDLSRELVFEDDADEFIVALSTLGLLTEIWPPADPAASLLKTAKKTDALTEPLQKEILRAARHAKEAKSLPALKQVQEVFGPVWDLSKRCRTWSQFKTLLKHVESSRQAKVLIKMLDTHPRAARMLEGILATLRKDFDIAQRALGAVARGGQATMDSLYKALRKGPRALRLVADHPTLLARLAKNVRKASPLVPATVAEWYEALARRLGGVWTLLRYGLIALLLALLAGGLRSIGRQLLGGAAQAEGEPPAGAGTGLRGLRTDRALQFTALAVVLLLAGLVLTESFGPAPEELEPLAVAAAEPAELPDSSVPMPGLTILIPLLVQAALFALAWLQLRGVEARTDASAEVQLQYLENLDIFFDLPLYAGLFFSVLSFILLPMDSGAGRLLAYTSTMLGILAAALLRAVFVFRVKQRLIARVEARP